MDSLVSPVNRIGLCKKLSCEMRVFALGYEILEIFFIYEYDLVSILLLVIHAMSLLYMIFRWLGWPFLFLGISHLEMCILLHGVSRIRGRISLIWNSVMLWIWKSQNNVIFTRTSFNVKDVEEKNILFFGKNISVGMWPTLILSLDGLKNTLSV